MSSLGTSPVSASLLNPPNPAFSPPEQHPRGGILINTSYTSAPAPDSPRRSSEPTSPSPPAPPMPLTPVSNNNSPISEKAPPSILTHKSIPLTSPGLHPPRIRFAPLPDAHRPRSLSTGRNIAWTATTDENGQEMRRIEIRGVAAPAAMEYESDDGAAIEDDDDDDVEGVGGEKRGRSWSKTMTWKGTKKLLTTGKLPKENEDDEGYSSGAPLKKSVSTGGFIGSPRPTSCSTPGKSVIRYLRPVSIPARPAPSLTTADLPSVGRPRRNAKNSMQGPQPQYMSSFLTSHRRSTSSIEQSTTPTGSSPTPVKLLNGRVYGSRRASEAAEREKKYRASLEPAFVEWGHGKTSAGLGSNAPKPPAGDVADEEGSGMEWVRRRRKEREEKARRESEQLESASEARASVGPVEGSALSDAERTSGEQTRQPGLSSSQSSNEDSRGAGLALTPVGGTTDLPSAPAIQITEYLSPGAGVERVNPLEAALKQSAAQPVLAKSDVSPGPAPGPGLGLGNPLPETSGTQAITIGPARNERDADVDVFGVSPGEEADEEALEDEEEGGEEEEEEEDDGDFEEDEEEEEDVARTTAAAAGVEVVSRHKA